MGEFFGEGCRIPEAGAECRIRDIVSRRRAGLTVFIQNGYCKPAHTDQPARIVFYFNVPYMGGIAEVQWCGRAGNITASDATYMIGIDLKADTYIFFRINNEEGSHAANGFGKGTTGAAVQQAIGLVGPVVHGHAHA